MARPASGISHRIVHAARERFLLEGVDGASLRRIAKDAKTSIGMVYYYFPTKDDLFQAVVEEVYTVLLADLQTALAPDAPVEDRVTRVYQRMGAMSDVEFIVVRLIIREAMISSSRLKRLAILFSQGHIPLVLQLLADGTKCGDVRGDLHPAVLATSMAAIGVFPQLLRRLIGPLLPTGLALPDGPEVATQAAALLFGGIANSGVRPAPPPRAPRTPKKPKKR